MAIVLTNGEYYIKISSNGKISKTLDVEEAQSFYSCNVAMRKVFRSREQCNGFYPYDTEDTTCNMDRKRKKREVCTAEVRMRLYQEANGRCRICGRTVQYRETSVDHIIPLSLGGADSEDNIQLSCKICNRTKAAFTEAEFLDRVSDIFFYQMENRHQKSLRWKIMSRILKAMI